MKTSILQAKKQSGAKPQISRFKKKKKQEINKQTDLEMGVCVRAQAVAPGPCRWCGLRPCGSL